MKNIPFFHPVVSSKISVSRRFGPEHESAVSRWEFVRPLLLELLYNLADVQQSSRFHPEGDALYHSLQVFQCACHDSCAPEMWAAALLHDVGKAIDYPNHAFVGARALKGIIHADICWLIEHHLDLLIHPRKTRQRYSGHVALDRLEKLRRWDLAGRNVSVEVLAPEGCLDILEPYARKLLA